VVAGLALRRREGFAVQPRRKVAKQAAPEEKEREF
jgi:hypothetical protein